jgi:hypothetical protein
MKMQSSLSRRALQLGPRLRALHTLSQLHTNGLPASVRIVEVGPRDGLQNEASPVSASVKLQLIHQLYQAGLRSIEAGAFVSPKWVPQMADSDQVFQALGAKQAQSHYEGATFSALTPNLQGLRAALQLVPTPLYLPIPTFNPITLQPSNPPTLQPCTYTLITHNP